MAGRKQSIAEDVIDVVSQLHWGVGAALALVSCLGLHWYAGQKSAVATGIEKLSTNMLINPSIKHTA
jgi:hypothetical protein